MNLLSYRMAAQVLEGVLPLQIHPTSIYCNTQEAAKRIENEIEEETFAFIEGCERDWGNLPRPDAPFS